MWKKFASKPQKSLIADPKVHWRGCSPLAHEWKCNEKGCQKFAWIYQDLR